jgi:hypothetical protein
MYKELNTTKCHHLLNWPHQITEIFLKVTLITIAIAH